MNSTLSKPLLAALEDFTVKHLGLQFIGAREKDLERGIKAIAEKMGFAEVDACAQWLLNTPLTTEQIEVLASTLTIGETYFFRDAKYFEALENKLLPNLINTQQAQPKRLRIWSAGCSTGEEPYTIAMIIKRLIPNWHDWQITVLATDINTQAMSQLTQGIYREWSFRDVPAAIKTEYFSRDEQGNYILDPNVKAMVTSSFLNLATDVYPSIDNNTNAMDIIFCRNVLMYFAPEIAEKVVQQLVHCLAPGGWLIVSPCECGQNYFSQMQAVNFATETGAGITLYQKLTEQQILNKKIQKEKPRLVSNQTKQKNVVFLKVGPQQKNQPKIQENKKMKNNVELVYKNAQQYYQDGFYNKTIMCLEQAIAIDKATVDIMELFARAYANLGQLDMALAWTGRAIKKDKTNIRILYLHALILEELSDFDAAMTAFKEILYLDHNFVLAHFNLGHIALHFGLTKEANKYFSNALNLASHFAPEDIIPESDGLTVNRLLEVIDLQQGKIDKSIAGDLSWK